jgi:hypothetical protein
MLCLLKSANARPGSQTEHTVDFSSVVTFVPQSLLHLSYFVWIRPPSRFFAEAGSRREHRRACSRGPDRQQYESKPSANGFTG